MVSIEQINELKDRLAVLAGCVGVEEKRREVEARQLRSQAQDFWDDPKAAEVFLKGTSAIKYWVDGVDGLSSSIDDLEVLL